MVAALSLVAWAAWALAAWLVASSLGIELSAVEVGFVAAAVNLGVAIPSSPGFVGTYQWLGVATLGLFSVPGEAAFAFAVLLQAAWFVPVTLVGLPLAFWLQVRSRRPATVEPPTAAALAPVAGVVPATAAGDARAPGPMR